MTWLPYIFFGLWAGTLAWMAPKFNDQPWDQVASEAYVLIINQTQDTVVVGALARKVDHTIRVVGWVPAQDSTVLRLPYVDTAVTLLVGMRWIEFDAKNGSMHRYELRNDP
jgi:hypothetical protein